MSESIAAQYDAYRAMTTADLRAIYARHHRVCDLNGVDKQSLITGILTALYGRKAVEAAFAPITVEGRKGMKSTPFRKTFKDEVAMERWMEKHGDDITIDRYSHEAN